MRILAIVVFLAACFITLYACSVFKSGYQTPASHPIPIDTHRPICTECHDLKNETFPYVKFNHNVFFLENHRIPALTSNTTCNMCHRDAFCSQCHGGKMDLKPSVRRPEATDRRMPHRGDYLARHQIEGRINPVSCYRCHGNLETAETCVRCHGK